MKTRYLPILLLLSAVCFLLRPNVQAGELEDRLTAAESVIKETIHREIPQDLLNRCTAIAVFPKLLKGGFMVGGRFGRGIIMAHDRKTGRWSSPAFFTLWGGSYGLQAGVQSIDLMLIFMNKKGLNSLLESKVTLGADISVAAGKQGRRLETGTDASLTAEIQSFSLSKGAFAGLSVTGAFIKQDDVANQAFYGMELSARDILTTFDIKPPESAKKVTVLLQEYVATPGNTK